MCISVYPIGGAVLWRTTVYVLLLKAIWRRDGASCSAAAHRASEAEGIYGVDMSGPVFFMQKSWDLGPLGFRNMYNVKILTEKPWKIMDKI